MLAVNHTTFALGDEAAPHQIGDHITNPALRVYEDRPILMIPVKATIGRRSSRLDPFETLGSEPISEIEVLRVLAVRMDSDVLQTGYGSKQVHGKRDHHCTFREVVLDAALSLRGALARWCMKANQIFEH